EMIDRLVGDDPMDDPPAYMKIIKPQMPSPWEGEDDVYKFEEWLLKLLTYFQNLRITGPRTDSDRTRMLSEALKGEPHIWYYRNVAASRDRHHKWTFSEAVLALHRRFIHKDGEVEAAEQFYRAKYTQKGGISDLLDRMTRYADRMTERPGEYIWKSKFMAALPSEMEKVLRTTYLITPEKTKFSDMAHAAFAYEHALRSERATWALWGPGSQAPKSSGSQDKKPVTTNTTRKTTGGNQPGYKP
ncbi:uncharacterized protein C8Q71DRAFT_675622, partial [Rhodofomes roseus]